MRTEIGRGMMNGEKQTERQERNEEMERCRTIYFIRENNN